MATRDRDSSVEIGPLDALPQGGDGGCPAHGPETAELGIWLDGGVLACACPECGSPMAVRLWLMVADCWRCGTAIELTEEQERAARRLLEEGAAADGGERPMPRPKPAPADTDKPALGTGLPVAGAPSARGAIVPAAAPRVAETIRGRVPAAEALRSPRVLLRRLAEVGWAGSLWREVLRNLPAWLISLLVHLILILLLALWILGDREAHRTITLATALGPQMVEGDLEMVADLYEPAELELPVAVPVEHPLAPEPSAGEVELARASPLPVLEPLATPVPWTEPATSQLPAAAAGSMFAGRDPNLRAHLVRQAGGSELTESAVARGLRFLARHQNADGSWSLHAFHRSPQCQGQCSGAGTTHCDSSGTALALLPFLGAGQTHREGEYTEVVHRGLRWLVNRQRADGDLRGGGAGRMYAHGLAAIVLSEAYGMTRDRQLRQPAQRSLDFIIRAQHPAGGWRYRPGEEGDTSVVGWQLMALRSGQMAYLAVPADPFQRSQRFLDSVQTDRYGGRYAYMPGRRESPAMTAEALLCRQYLGWPRSHPGLRGGTDYLVREHPPNGGQPNYYYWYYATQVMRHHGGEPWVQWNRAMQAALLSTQETEGHAAGSWAPRGEWATSGGRLFTTSMAICMLEVYYRHLPLYQEDAVTGFGLVDP